VNVTVIEMAEYHKKIVMTVNQRLELFEKFENGELATDLGKDYKAEIK
jgi:hypothetical protein